MIDNEDDILTPITSDGATSERTTSERTTSEGSITNQPDLEKEHDIEPNIENESIDIIINNLYSEEKMKKKYYRFPN